MDLGIDKGYTNGRDGDYDGDNIINEKCSEKLKNEYYLINVVDSK